MRSGQRQTARCGYRQLNWLSTLDSPSPPASALPAAVNVMSLTGPVIECVKSRPILYDPKHPDYKDLRKKDKVWNEIGLELDQDGEEVKKKWRNIKDCYLKHLRAVNTKSGQNKRTYKNWQYAQQMEFLRFRVDTNFTESYNFEDGLEKGRAKRKLSSLETQPPSPKLRNQSLGDTDATDLIFLGYSSTIKKFSRRRQAIVKMRIAQIIMEEELSNLEDSDPSFAKDSAAESQDVTYDTQPCSSTSNFSLSMKIEESEPF